MVKALLARVPTLKLAVSATTRDRRPGEEDGREYWFLSDEEFQRRIDADDFLEWVDYVGHRYGTLISETDRINDLGRAPVLELELQGSLKVRDRISGSVTIFINAPLEELARRLRERATESAGEIGERIAVAREQQKLAGEFDHVVQNDDRERAASEVVGIVQRELNGAATMTRT